MFVIQVSSRNPRNLTRLIGKLCFASGFYVQSFCLDNVGYVKFDKLPLKSKQKEFSDFLILADNSINVQDETKHAKEKSVIIMNSKEKFKFPVIKNRKLKIYNIDAENLENKDIVLLGALTKLCDKVSTKAAKISLEDSKESLIAFDEGLRNVK